MLEEIQELLNNKNFIKLRSLFAEINCVDIAVILEELSKEQMILAFRLLPKETAAETFVELDSATQELLIAAFNDKELKEIINELYVDDTVDIIEEMPANVVKRILINTDSETRKAINEILKYPDDSAGSIMTTEYVDLKQHMTVADAFERIRKTGVDKETIYTCYVTDYNRKLLGLVTVKDLLLAAYTDIIGDIMEKNIIYAETIEDKEIVAHKFDKYDFLAIPVVDKEQRLVGIVTIDDAVDVIQEENTEDIEKMAAITPSDKPYLRTGVFEMFKQRIPWLLILMISATFTSTIIVSFENALSKVAVLNAFIPMFMGTGGNAGGQSSVTIIRSLALNDIQFKDLPRVLLKEFAVSLICGITIAFVGFAKTLTIDALYNPGITITVAMIVALTLALTVVLAKVVGCALPMLAKKVGFDPAVMASPFITTIVDALSLVVYFNIASIFLGL